jgi:hypothetical protein
MGNPKAPKAFVDKTNYLAGYGVVLDIESSKNEALCPNPVG